MDADDVAAFQTYLTARLQLLREAVLWKIEGLDDYDIRRPLTPTGSNLLGLIKHLATVEFGYFGDTFGRPSPEPLPWLENAWTDNADMWATADETVEFIVGLYRRSWRHAEETFDRSDLMTPGTVPWWPPDRREVTLGQIIAHMTAETARHAGHMDILREGIDGSAGMRASNDNLSHHDAAERAAYVVRLQSVADGFAR